jgi:hypothetical protein
MVTAVDLKGRNILSEWQITSLAMLYSSLQGHKGDEIKLRQDLKDVHIFLDALAMGGWAILTQGAVDEMWNILSQARKLPVEEK